MEWGRCACAQMCVFLYAGKNSAAACGLLRWVERQGLVRDFTAYSLPDAVTQWGSVLGTWGMPSDGRAMKTRRKKGVWSNEWGREGLGVDNGQRIKTKTRHCGTFWLFFAFVMVICGCYSSNLRLISIFGFWKGFNFVLRLFSGLLSSVLCAVVYTSGFVIMKHLSKLLLTIRSKGGGQKCFYLGEKK